MAEGADLNVRMQTNLDTPLHTAACWGCISSLQTLIEVGKVNLNPRDEFGSTPLHYAVDEDKPEAVRLLIAYGAGLNLENAMGETALDMATKFGHKRIQKLLQDANASHGSGRIWHQLDEPTVSARMGHDGEVPAKRQHMITTNEVSKKSEPVHSLAEEQKDMKEHQPKASPETLLSENSKSPDESDSAEQTNTVASLERKVQEYIIQKEAAAGEFIKKCLDFDAQERIVERMKQSLDTAEGKGEIASRRKRNFEREAGSFESCTYHVY